MVAAAIEIKRVYSLFFCLKREDKTAAIRQIIKTFIISILKPEKVLDRCKKFGDGIYNH